MIQNAMDAYKKASINGSVDAASPHRLIQMLMEGALARIAEAKGAVERKDTARKGELIGSTISIIQGLQVSLDREAGGDIATNLDMLYDYMQRRLLEANVKTDASILNEVAGLIHEIKSAWDTIAPEVAQMKKIDAQPPMPGQPVPSQPVPSQPRAVAMAEVSAATAPVNEGEEKKSKPVGAGISQYTTIQDI